MTETGVIYIATGPRHVREAVDSAQSVMRVMPETPLTLFTDDASAAQAPPHPFHSAVLLRDVTRSCLDKMHALRESPYERTIMLDTDTYVCESIADVFDALLRFDVTVAYAPNRYPYPVADCPDAFPEPNTGVIGYRRSDAVWDFLEDWPRTYADQMTRPETPRHDQHAFREALYRSELRFLILPMEYNLRTLSPGFLGNGARVKIIHGSVGDVAGSAARLNRSTRYRAVVHSPLRRFSGDLVTMRPTLGAIADRVFEHLPKGLQAKLTRLRHGNAKEA